MKTMTVARLHNILGKLMVEDKCGRVPVCVNKASFSHPLEGDGLCILHVADVEIQPVLQMDDDGGTDVNKDGSEIYRTCAVISGDGGHTLKSIISHEAVEDYINRLPWFDGAPDIHKTLVAGNVRSFAQHLRQMMGESGQ